MGFLGSQRVKCQIFKASTSLGPEQRDAWEKWMKIQTKVGMKMLSDGQWKNP